MSALLIQIWQSVSTCLHMRRAIVTFQLCLNMRRAQTFFGGLQYISSALNDTGLEGRAGIFGVSTDDPTKDLCSSASSFLGIDPEALSDSHATTYPRSECIFTLRCQGKEVIQLMGNVRVSGTSFPSVRREGLGGQFMGGQFSCMVQCSSSPAFSSLTYLSPYLLYPIFP